jgi:signal recognition particle GTPase
MRNCLRLFSSIVKEELKKIHSRYHSMEIRDKPFIVIAGCTGTGKTKMSIELAQWLISNGKKCEIINADAMQVLNFIKKQHQKTFILFFFVF